MSIDNTVDFQIIAPPDPSVVTVEATDAIAGEPGSGQGTGTFTFTRTGSTAASLTVNFSVGGDASPGADYGFLGTSVIFNPGFAAATKTVNVINDTELEDFETVIVTLAAGTGYVVGSPSTATVEISDDDTVLKLSVSNVTVDEGNPVDFFVALNRFSNSDVIFDYATADGTALAGQDYVGTGDSGVSIPAGALTTPAPVSVETVADGIVEPDETFDLVVSNISGATVGETVTDPPLSSDLVLHLDATRGVSIVGGNVSSWLDQSLRDNHVTASGNPQLAPALTPGGLPAISLDGNGDKLERIHATNPLSGLPAGNADRTMFAVAKYNGPGAWAGAAYGNGAPNQAFGLAVVHSSGELLLQGWGSGNDLISSTPGIGAEWLVQSAVLSTGTATLFKDGDQVAQWTHNYNTVLSKLVIGGEIANFGFVKMDVAAVLIYNRALNGNERSEVESYLRAKYLETPTTTTGTATIVDRIVDTFFDDFDPGIDVALWAQFGGAVAANTNGQAAGPGSTGNSLWFGGNGSRFATTQPVNTINGGGVSFLLALGNDASSEWEEPEPGDEVVLEFSNDGATFVQFAGPFNNKTWKNIAVAIPPEARTATTRFRFRQLNNSGTNFDHWAIDDVRIASTVVAPEIAVEQLPGTNLTDGASVVDFGQVPLGFDISLGFAVRNFGAGELTGLNITVDGPNSGDFGVFLPPSASVAPGGSTTFIVQFAPKGSGTRTANLRIASNDADEDPFDIVLAGVVFAADIAVEQPVGNELTNGSTADFGPVELGLCASIDFTVRNVGTTDLTGLGIIIDGENPGDFIDFSSSKAPMAPGESRFFTFLFCPKAIGTRTANLHIFSNDADENPFDITLTGTTGYTPLTADRGWYGEDGNHSPSNENYLTGFSLSSGMELRSFFIFTLPDLAPGETILSGELHLANPVNGYNSPDATETLEFHEVTTPLDELADGTGGVGSFADLGDGTRFGGPKTVSSADNGTTIVVPLNASFTSFANSQAGNDIALGGVITTLSRAGASENIFGFSGSGVTRLFLKTGPTPPPAPEIAVEQPAGTDLTDGASTVDFGPVELGSTSSLEFTIRNDGTTDLTGIGVGSLNFGAFSPTDLPANRVLPGGSTTFTMVFAPSAVGTHTADLLIPSNDADESPFVVTLTGTCFDHVISASDRRGWYREDGFSDPPNDNYFTGHAEAEGMEFRSFFIFDLPNLPPGKKFKSAELHLSNPSDGYVSPDATETLEIREVTTPPDELDGGTGGVAAFADLGDGVPFGDPQTVSSADNGTTIVVPLNASFTSFADPRSGSAVALGGAITTLSAAGANEGIFARSGAGDTRLGLNIGPIVESPEITVKRPGFPFPIDVPDGSTVDFGSSAEIDFTVCNDGTTDLTILDLLMGGPNPTDFDPIIFDSDLFDPIPPGGRRNITVHFSPGNPGAGRRMADLQIISNDADENPFDIHLIAGAAEIAVEQPPGNDLTDGASTVDFGSIELGSESSRLFTVHNFGITDVISLNITIDGPNPGDFVVTVDPTAPVPPGNGTVFVVEFAPSSSGPRTANLHIANNDPNENPFDITLTGIGCAAEISVELPFGIVLTDGAPPQLGILPIFPGDILVFTVCNNGCADLTDLGITIDGANPGDFIVTFNPVAPVPPFGCTTFGVEFAPSGCGTRTVTLHIASNDADEGPFDIPLIGVAPCAEIAVEQPPGNDLTNGSTVDFGPEELGSTTSLFFTIRNDGTADLTDLDITIDGDNPGDFMEIISPVAPVVTGGSTIFTVEFAPSGLGTRTANLHIASNDPNEDPFDITLTGSGVNLSPVTHSAPGYQRGGQMAMEVMIEFTGQTLSSLRYEIQLPPDWSYVSDTSTAGVVPDQGQTDRLDWIWITIPVDSETFTVTLAAPATASGDQTFFGAADLRDPGGNPTVIVANPDPLAVPEIPLPKHTADFGMNSRIEPGELQGVVSLFNHRDGSIRTGEYNHDGLVYRPGPGPRIPPIHSTDTGLDWHINLTELLGTVTLYNYRDGTVRTGDYHFDAVLGTFVPGPLVSEMPANAASELAAEEADDPETSLGASVRSISGLRDAAGGVATFEVTMNYPQANVSALGLELTLPAGWSFVSDRSGAAVAPRRGQTGMIEWAWITIPDAPVTFTLDVNYPEGLDTETISGRSLANDPGGARREIDIAVESSVDLYPIWVEAIFPQGTPAEQSIRSADADGDGLANFVERALDLDPLRTDVNPLNITKTDDRGAGGSAGEIRIEVTYERPDGGVPGVAYTLMTSTDLITWNPVTVTVIPLGDGRELVVYEILWEGAARYFLLEVTDG